MTTETVTALQIILSEMVRVMTTDDYLYIAIWGDAGTGKTCLGLALMGEIFGSWEVAFNHLVFREDEFWEILTSERGEDGRRCKMILWDDFAVDKSAMDSIQSREMKDFAKLLTTIRIDLHVLITTSLHIKDLPSFMRRGIDIEIHCPRRGIGIIEQVSHRMEFKKLDQRVQKKAVGLVNWVDVAEKAKTLYNNYRKRRREYVDKFREESKKGPLTVYRRKTINVPPNE